MIKKYIRIAFAIIAFPLVFAGCEVFGLDLQEPYDYDYEAGTYDNHINMTVWEFVQTRQDLFPILKEAIEYAEMQNMYNESAATYILLTDKAFNSTTSTDLSYFQTHKLYERPGDETSLYAPISMTQYPKEQVKEFLLYHIVKGAHTWSNLPAEPKWFDSYASADTAKVNMYLIKDRNPNIVFNNFNGHYKSEIKPRTSNLLSTSGAYIHVVESWIDRPTKDILK
ncbi:fasciclin domain-containing protein [Dysgonomonas sp. GY617]|uniref:fasciclin domain-containing protein n=1 Tax=Dysgonomonas sp. GY617 TaxID=2780420 RepID=UPI001883CE0E|nr:fasciclin domain-containing protein [Dysgonomonas sp. GY617]MBF0576973.1 fasciclin domain-containing protein [Dysgonomonas sp. GY617]